MKSYKEIRDVADNILEEVEFKTQDMLAMLVEEIILREDRIITLEDELETLTAIWKKETGRK